MWNVDLSIIAKWFKERTKEQRASIYKRIALLEELGSELGLPNVRNLKDGLFELREMGFGYRLYFFFISHSKQIIIVLAAGDKNTQEKDIEKAKQLLKKMQEKKNETNS